MITQKTKKKQNKKIDKFRNWSLSSYLEKYTLKKIFSQNIFSKVPTNSSISVIHWKEEPLSKIMSRGRPETSPKNLLTSLGLSHVVLYVTPRDTSAAGHPWDALWTSL